MEQAAARKLIVSFTSYPARICFVPAVLSCLLAQSRPADRIVLYLSEDQFPEKEKELPEELLKAAAQDQLLIRWVPGDLKPHKKYLYAFREYLNDIVVTVDDDVLYAPDLLENLWQAHLQYPRAVVAGRTHLITLDRHGEPERYSRWIHCTSGFESGPSMQLFAVGIGGVLYDPGRFPPELFSEESIRSLCLEADDLWLKAMELAAGIPVVRAPGPELIRLIPGSQDTALYLQNQNRDRNDLYMADIRAWVTRRFGEDVIRKQLNDPAWPRLTDQDSLYDYLNRDKRRMLIAVNTAYEQKNARLNRTKELLEKSEKRAADLENTVQELRNSLSYRLGNRLVTPFSRLRARLTRK